MHHTQQKLESTYSSQWKPRYGLWIFVGMRFARILGPSQGKGTVASAYCQSLAQLRQIRGKSEVDKELNNLYEAVFGA